MSVRTDGRSDHLGGDVNLESFKDASNATHDDILFDPEKTPEVEVPEVRMVRDGESRVLLAKYQPAEYIQQLLTSGH